MRPTLVLASSSPRRARLLTDAQIPFEVRPADVDERVPRGKLPAEACVEIAARKARAIVAPGAWVLAADTLIDFEGRVVGKPADETEAHAVLRMLSGQEHRVLTGVAVKPPQGELRTALGETRVTFRELADEEIDAYIRTGDPLDKAGAYGIQGHARKFIENVDGAVDNVIGLPMDLVRRLLAQTGYPL